MFRVGSDRAACLKLVQIMSIPVPAVTTRLDQLFHAQAARTPDAPAIYFQNQVVSYAALAATVERLARGLTASGVGPGVLVGLSLQRSPDLVAALLATLTAGGAYLPLDSRNPPVRTRFILEDSGCSVMLGDSASPSFEGFGGTVLELSNGSLTERAYRSPPAIAAPAELAYVIYTSGSTGTPKGVMLGHGAEHLVRWAERVYSPEDRARMAATTSLSFDPSVFEIFVPLCTGGAIILKQNILEPFGPHERPTMLGTVPSALAELCRTKSIPDSVRILNVGGETLRAELAREAYRGRPKMVLHNHYGPTEATTVAAVACVSRDVEDDPPIGRPVRGAEIVLMGDFGQAVPDGHVGEIFIGGLGLALGYLGRPDLNAARFVAGPVGPLYRTGDLASWQDGQLHFAGRLDQQVKIRGFRVELGEVELALMRLPQVEQALAIVRLASGRSRLVAYVQSRQPITLVEVRAALAVWLPDYMLPAQLVVLREFPLLVSGKIDHARLPDPIDAPGADDAPRANLGLADSPPAASRTERPIIHVFEEVLARRGVGPDDSFFDLGGDSLASIEAALRLGEIFGYDVPAALIHQSPTPRSLARSLEHGRVRTDGHVSLLQQGGNAPPLFCVADLFGQPFNYLSLARRLAVDRSIYGIAPGPLQAAFTSNGDLTALTQSFVAELRLRWPQGPYLIAGYSSGGMLALDLACALKSAGEVVGLVLLDASLQSRWPAMGRVFRWALAQMRRASVLRVLAALAGFGRLAVRTARGAPPEWIPRAQVAFAARMIKVGASYQPSKFLGSTLIIKAMERDPIDQLFVDDALLGWSDALKGPVLPVCVHGGHHNFMREPLVAETAREVGRFLSTIS